MNALLPNNKTSHPRAFTMMEMIIFMTMTVIIMGITVNAVGGARNRAHLKDGVNIVVDAIQTARSKARANLEVNGCTISDFEIEADSASTIPQQIRIVANSATCVTPSTILETFNLPPQVKVELDQNLFLNYTWPTNFAYETPSGDPLITLPNSNTPGTFDLIVSLRNGNNPLSQTITVSGLTGIPEL